MTLALEMLTMKWVQQKESKTHAYELSESFKEKAFFTSHKLEFNVRA